MNLDILKNKNKSVEERQSNHQDKGFVKNFMEELSNFIQGASKEKIENNDEFDNSITHERQAGSYQVVDFSKEGVFLQDLSTNKVFEEKNFPEELKNKVFNDCILKYENGKYSIDQEKTDEFMNNMVDIKDVHKK